MLLWWLVDDQIADTHPARFDVIHFEVTNMSKLHLATNSKILSRRQNLAKCCRNKVCTESPETWKLELSSIVRTYFTVKTPLLLQAERVLESRQLHFPFPIMPAEFKAKPEWVPAYEQDI